MFKGSHPVTIDAKGRFAIPTSYRQSLIDDCGGRLVVTRHYDGCLLVYPQPDFQVFEQELLSRGSLNPQVRKWQRFFIGNAHDIDMDRQGRLLLPAHSRKWAGINTRGMLAGMGRIFELWDEQRWTDLEADTSAELAAQAANGELPEALMDISL